MDKLWEQYTTDLRQRKIGHCRELHIANRWSVHDVICRLEVKYMDSDKAKFIVMPALDENDESNFAYGGGVGFPTHFYHDMRDTMDDASWKVLYMNQPIEREGLLYPKDEFRRYFDLSDDKCRGAYRIFCYFRRRRADRLQKRRTVDNEVEEEKIKIKEASRGNFFLL